MKYLTFLFLFRLYCCYVIRRKKRRQIYKGRPGKTVREGTKKERERKGERKSFAL
jgi:hypothetical protein